MKQLKDYLHLYLGCEIWDTRAEPGQEICILEQIGTFNTCYDNYGNDIPINEVKPILRTTQSVTHYEWGMAPKGSFHVGFEGCFYTPELFIYLLSLKIDLFGLVEAGLAIDATTLK